MLHYGSIFSTATVCEDDADSVDVIELWSDQVLDAEEVEESPKCQSNDAMQMMFRQCLANSSGCLFCCSIAPENTYDS
jgi:hypothetical protein